MPSASAGFCVEGILLSHMASVAARVLCFNIKLFPRKEKPKKEKPRRPGGTKELEKQVAAGEAKGNLFGLMNAAAEDAIEFVRGKMRLLNPNKFSF